MVQDNKNQLERLKLKKKCLELIGHEAEKLIIGSGGSPLPGKGTVYKGKSLKFLRLVVRSDKELSIGKLKLLI